MTKLFSSDNVVLWNAPLQRYKEVIKSVAQKKKKKELVELDQWFQVELPAILRGRSELYITKEELAKLMKWKLTRGKFRPRLTELVQQNSEKDVESISKAAFKAEKNPEKAVKELSKLKAVGPATASAVLAAGAPETYAFMADEALASVPGSKMEYTLKQYLQFRQALIDKAKSLNKIGDGMSRSVKCFRILNKSTLKLNRRLH